MPLDKQKGVRGVQYACNAYQKRLETYKIPASMSRVGNPYDNAKAESFMKTLKTEEVDAAPSADAPLLPPAASERFSSRAPEGYR